MIDVVKDNYTLMFGDCLERMKEIPDGSIDLILTDPPYQTTQNKWDSMIDLDDMFRELNRVINKNSCILLFGAEPFSSRLRLSNIKDYKYDWYWKKQKPTGFYNCKKQPLKDIETISVFRTGKYIPQGLVDCHINSGRKNKGGNGNYSNSKEDYIQTQGNYPRQVLEFSKENKSIHPTQKPVALLEYLIKTYTQEGETVLDFTFGSCSTGVACLNTNRKAIMIEKDPHYFKIGSERMKMALSEKVINQNPSL